MNKLENEELLQIKGGISITGSLLQYIIKGFNAVLDLGRYLGSSIRRIQCKNYCSL